VIETVGTGRTVIELRRKKGKGSERYPQPTEITSSRPLIAKKEGNEAGDITTQLRFESYP